MSVAENGLSTARDDLGELLLGVLHSDRNVVLRCGDRSMTFAEMQRQVLRLASALCSEMGEVGEVGEVEMSVAICVHLGFGLVVSLVAVLWRGLAFVPLDPSYPPSRLQFILEDSEAEILISQREILESLSIFSQNVTTMASLLIDSSGALEEQPEKLDANWESARSAAASACKAYIIYTSGSTGVPKGVMVSRQNFANVLLSFKQLLEERCSEESFQQRIRWIAHTTICFDIALLELFLPLILEFSNPCSVTLEILDRSISQSGDRFKHHLDHLEHFDGDSTAPVTTVLQATPSSFQILRSAGWRPHQNHFLLCGGEPFPIWLTQLTNAEIPQGLYNVYGPTETTIWSLVHQVEVKRLGAQVPLEVPLGVPLGVPIGKAIRNTTLQLDTSVATGGMDERYEHGPHGIRGELVIGGLGVSLGYWKQPELTKSRFFATDGVRYFRTGDLILEIQDETDVENAKATGVQLGKLFCLGRLDHQVKLNGFRIELGEIETLLQSLEEIQDAAVQVRSNRSNTLTKVLVAYVVWNQQIQMIHETHETSHETLVTLARRKLLQHLPDYMLPQHFVKLQRLPTTLNGKVDRKQLPDPWESMEATDKADKEMPRDLRQMVLQVIKDVIAGANTETISYTDHLEGEHWRHLGLNSTMAVSFSARLQESLKKCYRDAPAIPAIGPSIMFECRTVSELVSYLQQFTSSAYSHYSLSETPQTPEGSLEATYVRHVVSLGTLCMTAQAMEHWGLRRWPCPFDWIFSAPEMVTHCFSQRFSSFLDQKKYLPKPSNKAGHEIYSEMLQREVIFNHHNPMLAKDYDFFVSSVKSLQALMSSAPNCDAMSTSQSSQSSKSSVLFLLFNLEGRVQLKDVAIQELFQELNTQWQCEAWSFQLLVVKVHTKAAERPQHRLLADQCLSNGKLKNQLLVYELLSQGSHDGWRFSDEKDMQALSEIVLNGRDFRLLSVSPAEELSKCSTLSCPFSNTWLSTHCCHSCAKSAGSRHGDKCDGLEQRCERRQRPSEASKNTHDPSHSGTVSRATRFQESLAKAREMQRTEKSLQLQTSAVRKLRRVLLKHDLRSSWSSWSSWSSCDAVSIPKEWQFLGFPVYNSDFCGIWSPASDDIFAAFQTLMEEWDDRRFVAFLLVEASAVQAVQEAVDLPGSLFCFKANTDLFVAESAQLSEKLPRTAEEFLLFGNTNVDQTTQTT